MAKKTSTGKKKTQKTTKRNPKLQPSSVNNTIKICPICKSTNIQMDYSNPVQPALGLPPIYACKDCKHTGEIFPEILFSEVKKFQNEMTKKHLDNKKTDLTPKTDVRYGEFEVKVLWKAFAPVLIIISIVLLFYNIWYAMYIGFVGIVMLYITYFRKRKISQN